MQDLDRYNVVWDSPSKGASGSMPIGNGDLAANVWVEESTGDVLLLLAKNDAWDENSINLKLGRVRIKVPQARCIRFDRLFACEAAILKSSSVA